MSATFPMKVLLLELDKPTSATGKIYTSASVNAWIEKDDNLKALENGFLGEWGQDRLQSSDIKDLSDRVDAVMSTHLQNVCVKVTGISLEVNEDSAQLVGYIEPYGPKGQLLEEHHQDIEVAVRALVNVKMADGVLQHDIVDLITFDIDYSKTALAQGASSDSHSSELEVTVIDETEYDPRNPDDQYAELINDIRRHGSHKDDRTGTGSHSVFGAQMRFDLTDGKLPLLTTKKVHTRMIIHELLWMLSGDTNIRYLKENDVNIWDSWVKPDTVKYRDLTIEEIQAALKKHYGVKNIAFDHQVGNEVLAGQTEDTVVLFVGLSDDPWRMSYRKVFEEEPCVLVAGELPKIYQHQWRHWEDTRIVTAEEADQKEREGFSIVGEVAFGKYVVHREIDQIANAIEQLKTKPDSRRILVSAWNAAEIDEMALPPCFNENMLVATPHGYKEISTITEGDIVLSGTGVPSKVNTVWKTPYEGEMVRLYVRTLKSCPIECTPNHPFLVHGKGWVNAENLDEGDYLAIPKSKSGNDHTFQYTKRHCSPHGRCQDLEKEHSCTPDDYYTFGYFLGNGWLLEKSSKIHFSIPNHKLSVVLPKIRKTLKVAPKKMKSSSCSTFEIASKKWHDTFSEFGHLAHNKRIPQWIMESTMESKLEFLKGFNDADGCDSEKGAINVTTTSPHIAFTLQRLYCEFGVRVSVGYQKRPATTIIEGRTVNQRGTYLVRGKLGISKNPLKTFFDKDHMWVKLGKKERYRSKEDVYNLDVEGEHTYTVNNIVNHNCHTLFQFWTRELSFEERTVMAKEKGFLIGEDPQGGTDNATLVLDTLEVPRRALSCQLYQR